jgi:hypothetical protein
MWLKRLFLSSRHLMLDKITGGHLMEPPRENGPLSSPHRKNQLGRTASAVTTPTQQGPISLKTLDRDCFIIPISSLDRFLPAGVTVMKTIFDFMTEISLIFYFLLDYIEWKNEKPFKRLRKKEPFEILIQNSKHWKCIIKSGTGFQKSKNKSLIPAVKGTI